MGPSSQHMFRTNKTWWRHQMETFSALLVLCAGNSPVNSPPKGQWRGALMFSLICGWINDWPNNREACDLRRHCTHYDINVNVSPVLSEILANDASCWPPVDYWIVMVCCYGTNKYQLFHMACSPLTIEQLCIFLNMISFSDTIPHNCYIHVWNRSSTKNSNTGTKGTTNKFYLSVL